MKSKATPTPLSTSGNTTMIRFKKDGVIRHACPHKSFGTALNKIADRRGKSPRCTISSLLAKADLRSLKQVDVVRNAIMDATLAEWEKTERQLNELRKRYITESESAVVEFRDVETTDMTWTIIAGMTGIIVGASLMLPFMA